MYVHIIRIKLKQNETIYTNDIILYKSLVLNLNISEKNVKI